MECFLENLADIFINYLPQSLCIMLGMYAFNKQKVQMEKFQICMRISFLILFVIRCLPISFGVITILSMIVLIFLGVYYLDFSLRKAINSVLFTYIIILIIEMVKIKVLEFLFTPERFDIIMNNPSSKTLVGFPTSVVLYITIITLYWIQTRDAQRIKQNGEIEYTYS